MRWEERVRPYHMLGGGGKQNLWDGSDDSVYLRVYIPELTSGSDIYFDHFQWWQSEHMTRYHKEMYGIKSHQKAIISQSLPSQHPRQRCNTLWSVSHPPPLYILYIILDRLIFIDVDETGFYLSNVKKKYGWGHISGRIGYPSHYTRSDTKINVIMAINPGSQTVRSFVDGSLMFPHQYIFVS